MLRDPPSAMTPVASSGGVALPGATDENTSDIMTKALSTQPFKKHRKTMLNGDDEPASLKP